MEKICTVGAKRCGCPANNPDCSWWEQNAIFNCVAEGTAWSFQSACTHKPDGRGTYCGSTDGVINCKPQNCAPAEGFTCYDQTNAWHKNRITQYVAEEVDSKDTAAQSNIWSRIRRSVFYCNERGSSYDSIGGDGGCPADCDENTVLIEVSSGEYECRGCSAGDINPAKTCRTVGRKEGTCDWSPSGSGYECIFNSHAEIITRR